MSDNEFNDVLLTLLRSRYDVQKSKSEGYANDLNNVQSEFVKRNKSLTNLLSNYIEEKENRIKINNGLKITLFVVFVGLLLGLTIGIIVVFCKIDFNHIKIAAVTGLVSACVTYIGSLLAILRIMAKYLFPCDEEKDTIGMIKTVLQNDNKVEEMLTKRLKENRSVISNTLREYKKLLDEGILEENEYKTLKEQILSSYVKD